MLEDLSMVPNKDNLTKSYQADQSETYGKAQLFPLPLEDADEGDDNDDD